MGDGSVHPVRRSKAHPFRPCRICSALSAPAREGDYERRKEELDRVERQIRAVIEAIKDGLRTPGMKEELYALEARKRGLAAEVKRAPAPRPRLHPKLADLYRQRVDRLHEELNRTELRPTPPKLLGDLAGILGTERGKQEARHGRP